MSANIVNVQSVQVIDWLCSLMATGTKDCPRRDESEAELTPHLHWLCMERGGGVLQLPPRPPLCPLLQIVQFYYASQIMILAHYTVPVFLNVAIVFISFNFTDTLQPIW